jgi:hypothetical protein
MYRGLRTAPNLGTYPYANATAYDPANEADTFDHSLHMDGVKGIYERYGKEWIYFMMRKKVVTRRMNLSILDVLNYRDTDKVRIDTMIYFIKSMRLSFSDDGMDPVECELVSIPQT